MRRLKSLELHGYKTFASRTLFEFSDKITAVVGPNGSGKSNIADSLRWVLGEQSYALLRGKKTEDMIFTGSESRPRSGMASATVVFDNSDDWLPIDFSEVAITRRAYRDGQNEYLINGQRMRLKDVSELLAQSGLAERTYTIIGQGLVDTALALKAEERRKLFEEAAGIGLHRSRREEALRRLETTSRNLERVEDILAELKPRLQSLERQARRSQEYEQVKADLRIVLREWYGYHWHLAQKDLGDAREALRQREATLEKSRQELSALVTHVGEFRERIQSLRASLNSWHRQSAQLHNQREALSRELAVSEERHRSLNEQKQTMQSELERLVEDLSLRQQRVDDALKDVERLEGELQEAQAQQDLARKALMGRQIERARVEKELQSARHVVSNMSSRQGQLQARISERQAQLEKRRNALQDATRVVEEAEREQKSAESQLKNSEEKQKEAAQALKTAEEAVQAHAKKIEQAEAEQKKAQQESDALKAEMERSRARLEVLEQAERSLAGYANGTRLLLQASRQSKLQGALGALTNFLEIEPAYEAAIAAALGEYLDAVLLDGEADGALDLLQSQAARGALLPLKRLKPELALDLQTSEGVIGVAADLVKTTPEARPAVDLLLGQVVVVRDRQAARRALAERHHSNGNAVPNAGLGGLRVVTLKGELFFDAGPVLAGAGGGEAGAQTILSRNRQRKELQREMERLQSQSDAIQSRMAAYLADLKNLRVEAERLQQSLKNKRQLHEQASIAARQARLVLEQAVKQIRWQQDQRARLESELKQGEAEAASMAKELAKIDGEIAGAREQLRSLTSAFAALSVEEFQAQQSHWNTVAAVSEQAVTNGKTRLREAQDALARALKNQQTYQLHLTEYDQMIASLASERETHRQEEIDIAEKIDALRKVIEPAEAELQNMEAEQSELQNQEAAGRQAVSVADHHYAQAKILHARRQETVDSLRRRIEEDVNSFAGLVAFEYAEQVSGPTPLPFDGMVEQLPKVDQLSPDIEETIKRQRAMLRRMGPINPDAQEEYNEVKQRYEFLTEQVADLGKAEEDIRQVIIELDTLMQREFLKTFNAVAAEFKQIFSRLFAGGSAQLILTDPDNITETGIDIETRLPGRRTQSLSLLSGGERSLTATSLVFSLLKVSPTPFCVFDEVDAMLDEANVGRFRDLLTELCENTQFVVVTHNRNTVQAADVIYGVTMGRDSASQVVSLKMDDILHYEGLNKDR